ncbi:hypothetical protein DUI87_06713 [Hirundo rustica rustica]|uniref:Uncharacterized protein n=1 Tax=Hirundo rustica rustica TaxID=333673 RepID=A0A3M0KTX5_HIRRU|nr:hypothetical protein DUI87_06713 [Hirundo rustica rustica]
MHEGGCDPVGSHCGAVSWQDLCVMERVAHAGAGLLAELGILQETHTGVKSCSILEGFTVENLWRTVSHGTDPMLEQAVLLLFAVCLVSEGRPYVHSNLACWMMCLYTQHVGSR